MNRIAIRYFLPCLMLALSSSVSAIGLGELRGFPHLGESLKLEIDLLGADKAGLDSTCFRLIKPADGSDLPWLKKADLRVRRAASPVLEIRSNAPVREPVLQLAVQIGCGHEVSREYMVFASPFIDAAPAVLAEASVARGSLAEPAPRHPAVDSLQSAAPTKISRVKQVSERHSISLASEKSQPVRMIPPKELIVGEPVLRLSTDLVLADAALTTLDAQREILRLEYRMLLALHEQVATQMATAEKLRSMESALGELQQHTAAFAQRLEHGAVPSEASISPKSDQLAPAPSEAVRNDPPAIKLAAGGTAAETPPASTTSFGEWRLYAILFGSFLGLGCWLGWRHYAERPKSTSVLTISPIVEPEAEVDPRRETERDETIGHSQVEMKANGDPMPEVLALDGEAQLPVQSVTSPAPTPDSVFSISATTVDEHFEANPVMELADIMLSFGRVKGAAQALQEYIDHNPQEALQPWIRLMEVYRMAGMREEFEAIAQSLNQNFNVEIQQWDAVKPEANGGSLELALDDAPTSSAPAAPRPQCLEDMPRIMNMVVELWPSSDVVGFLYQLLRDNRGGQRVGFALPVVEEILFLVELKETANRIE